MILATESVGFGRCHFDDYCNVLPVLVCITLSVQSGQKDVTGQTG